MGLVDGRPTPRVNGVVTGGALGTGETTGEGCLSGVAEGVVLSSSSIFTLSTGWAISDGGVGGGVAASFVSLAVGDARCNLFSSCSPSLSSCSLLAAGGVGYDLTSSSSPSSSSSSLNDWDKNEIVSSSSTLR